MTTPSKIYRGGIPNTTAITREAHLAIAAGSVLPGTLLTLNATGEFIKADGAAANGTVIYVLGEQMYGGIDDSLSNADGSVRAYELQGGHLYAVRSAGDLEILDDAELSITAGQAAEGAANVSTRLFVDCPAGARSDLDGTTPAADALIPVKYI